MFTISTNEHYFYVKILMIKKKAFFSVLPYDTVVRSQGVIKKPRHKSQVQVYVQQKKTITVVHTDEGCF